MIDHALFRPWLVSLPPRMITPYETLVWELEAPRDTPSFRKLTLEADRGVVVTHVTVAGRDLLPEGGFPVSLFAHDKPETFDARIERGCPIRVVVENLLMGPLYLLGYLLGTR